MILHASAWNTSKTHFYTRTRLRMYYMYTLDYTHDDLQTANQLERTAGEGRVMEVK